jgi:sodium/hydrogen antiporter
VEIDTALAIVGGALLALGLLSRILKRLFLSSVLLALVLGVAVGPEGLALLDPAAAGEERKLLEEVARVTLAIAVMGAGLQLTRSDLRENARRGGLLLTAGMAGMWVATGLGAWLILDVPFWAGFLLGAILTPTDPVVSSTIVTGPLAEKNLPRWLRRSLQLESGANDGLALPFVLLAAFMLTLPSGEALSEWAVESLRQVGVAAVAGVVLGFGMGRLVELLLHRNELEETSLLGVGIALSLFALGFVQVLGGSGIVGVFVAAVAFSTVLESTVREELEEVQETITKFLVLPVFILFGTMLPWSQWEALGLSGLAFAAWALIVRRPAVVLAALVPSATPSRGSLFLSWFGPLGVAAIFYATHVERFGVPGYERLFAFASLAICTSVLVHSLTATPAVRWFAGRSLTATVRDPLSDRSEDSP